MMQRTVFLTSQYSIFLNMAVEIITDDEFQSRLTENELVAVKYFADWCGSCRLFAPKFRRLSEDERFEGITFLDINAENNPEARKTAGVPNLPYFAIFNGGKLVDGVATNKEELVVDLISRLKQ